METVVKINLWGHDVAAIAWNNDKNVAVIEFFDTFAATELNTSPLMMPLNALKRGERIFSFPNLQSKTFQGLPGMIADSLPDDYGNTVIDEWFSRKGINQTITPLERLLYVGKRAMGALEYEPSFAHPLINESSQIAISELAEIANDILNEREKFQEKINDNKKSLIDILKVGTSAGGAKPKAIIAYNEKTKEVRSGQTKAPDGFSYWLMKFDGVEGGKIKDNPAGIGNIEFAYHKMAVDCQIQMTECTLWHENDKAHFMTKRFDRTDSGDKLHTQTLCGLAHFDRDNRHSYEQIFQIMRQLYLPYSDLEQMYRRMVFNVAARNHDDHTKNHSFIMNKEGEWALAPAYDLCYSYSPSGQWTNKHQLSVNGKRSQFTYDDLITVAQKADIKNPKIIIEQINHVISQWTEYAKDAYVPEKYISQINENVILIK